MKSLSLVERFFIGRCYNEVRTYFQQNF